VARKILCSEPIYDPYFLCPILSSNEESNLSLSLWQVQIDVAEQIRSTFVLMVFYPSALFMGFLAQHI